VTHGSDPYRLAATAGDHLRARLGEHDVAVVLGSGWSEVATAVGRVVDEMPIPELPGSPAPTVVGHEGTLRSLAVPRANSGELRVLMVAGRSHLYEGHHAAAVVHTVRSAVLAGVDTVVLTNAAGSLRPDVGIGTTVVIADQLNLTGDNPLCGPSPPGGQGERFVDLTDLYDRRLRERVLERSPGMADGVYAGLRGGSFETPAEIRMLRVLGADLVGMSTVLEAIAAKHLGASVVGLSLVTNLAAGMQPSVDHLEVLAAGRAASGSLLDAVTAVLAACD
jgi:purine-nucleoside phosphorylase